MAGGAAAIGAGANVVGGLLQSIAASQAAREMGREFRGELNQQNQYRNQALGILNPYLQNLGVEQARTELGQGAASREQLYNQVRATPSEVGAGGFGTSARDALALQMMGNQRANLGKYSDWQLQRAIEGLRTQDQLNKISNFAAGTASTFPLRMQDAQHSWDELAFWGNLISSIGGTAQGWGNLFGENPSTPGTTPATSAGFLTNKPFIGYSPMGPNY